MVDLSQRVHCGLWCVNGTRPHTTYCYTNVSTTPDGWIGGRLSRWLTVAVPLGTSHLVPLS